MKDRALIIKILGIWPSEKHLMKGIKHWWNPKGHYELQLSSKGLFTIIFYNLEDKDRVFKKCSLLLQLDSIIYVVLERSLLPKKRRLCLCNSLDTPVLPSLGVLARGNPDRHLKHARKVCQIITGHEVEKIHFLCMNMCLHEYLEIPSKICYHRVSRRRMDIDHRLLTHPLHMLEMSWTWESLQRLPPQCTNPTNSRGNKARWFHPRAGTEEAHIEKIHADRKQAYPN
jgi:hypothetical protein